MRKTTSLIISSVPVLHWRMTQNSQPGELYFNHLFVNDGMPEGTVTAIVQDKEGYMWIGTQKGLVRYDGYNPKVYNFGIEDPYLQDIGALYLDREDRLWVGGKNGLLFLYNRSEDRFIQYGSNLLDSNFSRFVHRRYS